MILNRPPMGWNSWNSLGADVNEDALIEVIDAMVNRGLRDAGYKYVVIDDCWSEKQRDKDGNLVADRKRFPHGLKYIADYAHSKDMKFGIYSSVGPLTCAGYPGSYEHEYQDAKFFADNGIDYLKYDWCYHPINVKGWTLYNRMKMSLAATGRDILYSICNWGEEDSPKWAHSVGGDMFRSTGDLCDSFSIVKFIYNDQKNRFDINTPTCYNDIDMLISGLHGMGTVGHENFPNDTEYKTHFVLWCMLSAPLMLGCDVRSISDEDLAYMTNKDLLSINQDEEVRPPLIAHANGNENNPVMFKHLSGGKYAISVTNFSDDDCGGWVGITLPEFGLDYKDGYALKLRNVFTGEELGTFRDYINIGTTKSHETQVFIAEMVKA